MRRIVVPVVALLVCLASFRHDHVDAGWKPFKKHHAGCAGCAMPIGCAGCAMPIGCAAPGCYAPTCGGPGCYAPAFHRPFAPLVAHVGWGCAAPHCGMPMASDCGCATPGCALPMDVTSGVDASSGFEAHNGLPLMTGVHPYQAPMGPMAAPIPSVPPAEDIAW
jgi:hypothetical protein